MANDAWFEEQEVPVEGFVRPECPHGLLRFEFQNSLTDSSYKCTECDQLFIAVNQSELDE